MNSGIIAGENSCDNDQKTDDKVFIRYFLSDCDKLKNQSDFESVKLRGKRVTGRYLIVLFLSDDLEKTARCGIICSRRFHKRSVVRNRARRLIWESFRLIKSDIQSCRFIVIPKRSICTVKMDDVKNELADLLGRI